MNNGHNDGTTVIITGQPTQPGYGQPAYGQPAYGQPVYPPQPAYYNQPQAQPIIITQ